MPKISEMFSTKTSNSAVLETVDIVGGTHLADNLNPEIFKELEQNTHYVDTTAEVAAECKSVCDDDHIGTTNLNSPSYLPDLGLWPTLVSKNMREYWIAKGSSECQNLDADFSATSTRFEGEKYNRQCQKSLFTFAHLCTKQQYPQRVAETIRHLAVRGLAFCGTNEIIGSVDNSNFLGTLELLAKIDPFMAQHINQKANKGQGHTSYLSNAVCEEFIHLMAKRVLQNILDELKASKYFSVSVDSTPDISHVDQLTCIVRYILPLGPVERFVAFLDMQGHTGKVLAESLLGFLTRHEVNISDCPGQSYDNASNMSGKYNGMQAVIHRKCPLAEYVPCAAHYLNLVCQSAVSCCLESVGFFGFVQGLCSFLVASTHRWKVVHNQLKKKGLPTVKRLSDTRWSAHAAAVKDVVKGYEEIKAGLKEIAADAEQKGDTRKEALNHASNMDHLETGILTLVCHHVLKRFNSNSQLLQSADQDINSAAAIYESLEEYVKNMRPKFEQLEAEGKLLSGCEHYEDEMKRNRQRNRSYDEPGSAPEELPDNKPTRSANQLCKIYPGDLEPSLSDELLQFSAFLKTELAERYLDSSSSVEAPVLSEIPSSPAPSEDSSAPPSPVTTTPSDDEDMSFNDDNELHEHDQTMEFENNDAMKLESPEVRMYKLILENKLETVFSNIEVALRIYLSLMISNCSGETSFSILRYIKNSYRSTMGQRRLNDLILLSAEQDILRELDINSLINDFALMKS
ncbi:zinc finger MYM-type 1-like [Paramuricea clavata]|uniref:Zinc finger MYM-type 1-like n=1 Tax=Paramuricea clavata TaxID=317549 RepID=A0A7D9IRY5_PARCT|nr:zinc finger MYM-type 1-like [Paramuricea clavata]